MAQQYRLPDGRIVEALPGGGYQVVQSGPTALSGADPSKQYEAPKAAADAARAQAEASISQAQAPSAGTIADAQARKAEAEARTAQLEAQTKITENAQANSPEAKLARVEAARTKGETALRAIDQVRRAIAHPGATGPVGQLAQYVAGSPAADKVAAIGTLQAIMGLDKLMEMKASSSSGASGLGQLSNKEMEVLRDQMGSLSDKQSPKQLLENLGNVERHFKRFLLATNGVDPTQYDKMGLDPFEKLDPVTANARAEQMLRQGAGADKVGEFFQLQGLKYDPEALKANVGNNGARVLLKEDPAPPGFQKGVEHVGARLTQGLEFIPNTLFGTNIDLGDQWQQSIKDRFNGRYVDPSAEAAGRMAASAIPALATGSPFLGGALQNTLAGDETDPMGIAQEALFGGIAGKVGDKFVRGIAGAIAPDVAPAARNLNNLGVRMTPGQILGGGAARAEGVRTTLPFAGQRIQNSIDQSYDDVQHAMGDEILRPGGVQADRSIPPGGAFVGDIQQKGSQLYNDALNGTGLEIDPRTGNRVISAMAKHRMRPDIANELTSDLQTSLGGMFGRGGPVKIPGQDWKAIDSQLGDLAESYRKQGGPYRSAANAVRDVRDELYRGLVRQNPGTKAAEVRAADQVHRGVRILNNAAARDGANNVPNPGQIMSAIKAEAPAGKTAFARGDAPLQGFASDVQNVMPSYANSRSADRAIAAMPTSKEGMMAHAQGLALSPLYSDPAQRVFQNFMMRDAYTAPRLGNALRDPRLGGARGMFGSVTGGRIIPGMNSAELQAALEEDRRRRLGY